MALRRIRLKEQALRIHLMMPGQKKNTPFNILKCLVTAPFMLMAGMPELFTDQHGIRRQLNRYRKIHGNYTIQRKILVLPITWRHKTQTS